MIERCLVMTGRRTFCGLTCEFDTSLHEDASLDLQMCSLVFGIIYMFACRAFETSSSISRERMCLNMQMQLRLPLYT